MHMTLANNIKKYVCLWKFDAAVVVGRPASVEALGRCSSRSAGPLTPGLRTPWDGAGRVGRNALCRVCEKRVVPGRVAGRGRNERVMPANGGYWQVFGLKKHARVPAIPNTGVRAAVRMFEEGDFAHYPVV
jgi:hypothetical protein